MSFTKNDLQTGDVIVTRDGTYMMYFAEYAGYEGMFVGIFREEYMDSSPFDDSMKNLCSVSSCDVVKVYRPFNPWIFPRSKVQIDDDYEVMFEEVKKKITMDEAVKRLSEIEGCEVEIV